MPPAPTDGNPNAWLLDEVANLLAGAMNRTVGTNVFIGELPEPGIDGTPPSDGLYLIQTTGGMPNQEIDTETIMIDVWSSSTDTKSAYELVSRAYAILHRKANYALTNWYIYLSYANSTIRDEGRGREGSKLFSLGVTLVCRNLNNIS